MQPNSVLGLVLAAVAIFFTGDNRRTERERFVACTIGAVVSLLGLLTLAEYIFSWDLGIDHILIPGCDCLTLPGPPGPQTAGSEFGSLRCANFRHKVLLSRYS